MRLVKALQDSGQEDLEDWTDSEVQEPMEVTLTYWEADQRDWISWIEWIEWIEAERVNLFQGWIGQIGGLGLSEPILLSRTTRGFPFVWRWKCI